MEPLPPALSRLAYADVPGANRAEIAFAAWAIAQGWDMTKRGWPDFICRRGDEVMCVEVKDGAFATLILDAPAEMFTQAQDEFVAMMLADMEQEARKQSGAPSTDPQETPEASA